MLARPTFGQAKDEEMVRETVDEEEAFSEAAFSSQRSAASENQPPPRRHGGTEEEKGLPRINADDRGFTQEQNLYTAKPLHGADAKDAKEKDQGLPMINTDDTDKESGLPRPDSDERGLQGKQSSREVEFVPVPGGYGFERVRLRIEPGLGGERRPVHAVISPEECAEVHAVQG